MRLFPLLVLVALYAGPGRAQPSTNVETSSAPVDITAQESQVFQLQHLTVFKGAVEVIKDDARMRTPELRVYSKPKDAAAKADKDATLSQQMGAIDHMDAAGPFYYVTPTQNARSDYMHYDAVPDIITLTGNVVLVQGKSVAKGDRLVMNRKTGVNDLTASEQNAPNGRIRAILYPQQSQTPSGQTAPK